MTPTYVRRIVCVVGNEASAAGAALVAVRWAKATKAERLEVGRELTAKRLAKAKSKRKAKKRSKS